ncbi:MAG: hypothetical protein EOO89_16110, partial [Pedobacter sp.]
MKALKNKILLMGMACLISIPGFSQQVNTHNKSGLEQYIIKFKDWKLSPHTKWQIELSGTKGTLYYYGAEHKDDPSDPQFNSIKDQFQRFKPTIVFYEGPDRGIALTDTATIKQFGESGYVRFLA